MKERMPLKLMLLKENKKSLTLEDAYALVLLHVARKNKDADADRDEAALRAEVGRLRGFDGFDLLEDDGDAEGA